MMVSFRALLYSLACLVLCAHVGSADEKLDALIAGGVDQDVEIWHGGDAEFDLKSGLAVFGGPGVYLRLGSGVTLYADDGLVVWGQIRGLSLGALRAVYAEGNVHVAIEGDRFEAQRVYLDLARGQGRLVKAVARNLSASGGAAGLVPGASSQGVSTLQVRAEQVRLSDSFRTLEADQALVSTCSFHVPHYSLAAQRIRVWRVGGRSGGEIEHAQLELEKPRLELGGMSVVGVPATLAWDTEWSRWLPLVRVGTSSRYGEFLVGDVPAYAGRDLSVHGLVHYFEKRGTGGGAKLKWRGPARDTNTYDGDLLLWNLRDHGPDRLDPTPTHERRNRDRVALFHREELPFHLRRELELSYLSDSTVLSEFFESDAKAQKEQETTAYLRYLDGNQFASLQGRWRLNDFQTQVEYLPRARAAWLSEPLFDSRWAPQLSLEAELGNVRRVINEHLLYTGPLDDRLTRADVTIRVDQPLSLGPLQVVPYAQVRESGYERTLVPGEHAALRTALAAGGVVSADFWRDFSLTDGFENWVRLRHIFTPSVLYERTFYRNINEQDLIPIGDVDGIDRAGAVTFSLRNRLLALAREGRERRELVDLDLRISFYPRPSESAFAHPEDVAGFRRWDLLRANLYLQPLEWLGGGVRASWDPEHELDDVRSDARVSASLLDELTVSGSYHSLDHTFKTYGGALEFRPSERWALVFSTSYDDEHGRHEFIDQRLLLRRIYHRFALEVEVSIDYGEEDHDDDFRFAVNFVPLEMLGRSTVSSDPGSFY